MFGIFLFQYLLWVHLNHQGGWLDRFVVEIYAWNSRWSEIWKTKINYVDLIYHPKNAIDYIYIYIYISGKRFLSTKKHLTTSQAFFSFENFKKSSTNVTSLTFANQQLNMNERIQNVCPWERTTSQEGVFILQFLSVPINPI